MTVRELGVLPPVSYFKQIKNSDLFMIEQCENYQKKSIRNRYKILAANGPLSLSIPLQKGKNNRTPIRDVRISYDSNWREQHLKSIDTAYANSPYYLYYQDELNSIFYSDESYLFDFNCRILSWLLQKLRMDYELTFTSQFENVYTPSSSEEVAYPQVFEEKFGFTPGLSALDLLMNCGPESSLYL